MIPKAMGPQKAGLTEYQKEQFDWAFEMLSCNVSPGLFQIERRGNVSADSIGQVNKECPLGGQLGLPTGQLPFYCLCL